eukprot:127778-Chlamydomonas_euryale.AAC.1
MCLTDKAACPRGGLAGWQGFGRPCWQRQAAFSMLGNGLPSRVALSSERYPPFTVHRSPFTR